jgi:hypothetical protein
MLTCKSLGHMGRMANQMFQISGVIGIATKNNHPYCFPKWENTDHKERFGSNEPVDLYNYFLNPLPDYVDLPYQYRWIDWGYHDVSLSDGAYDLCGHFQSDKYFSHCIDLIKHYFRMKDEYPQNDYVAIHYRAGDYQEGENVYHPRCTMSYYETAMNLFPNESFLVFTDDYDKATEMFGAKVKYAKGKDYIDDFKMMKSCKSFITANSSYSVMAAILGEHEEKKIVCPKKWFGECAGITFDGMYPQNAIVL